jgi:hypothetical protein
MSSSTNIGCAGLPALAMRMCCRESKIVQYGVQFHPPSGRQSRRKAGVKLQPRGPSAHETMIGPQHLCGSHDRLIYMIDLRRKQQSDT